MTAWFLYWRVARLLSRIGFVKESVWRNVFGRASYDGLTTMRRELDKELARRQPPGRATSSSL